MNTPQWFGLLFMAGGFGLVMASVQMGIRRRRLLLRSVLVKGWVVDIRQRTDSDSDAVWETPMVRYPTPTGANEFELPHLFSQGRWTIGDTVPVLYDGDEPAVAVWAKHPWSDVVMAGVLGPVVFGVGAGCFWLFVDPKGR